MTQTNVRVQMQIRRDTAANWSSANPTALAGELCYETDTGKIKVGTGSDAWIVLPYSFLPLSGGSLTDHLTIHNKKELRLSDATANTAGDHYSAFKAGTQSANLTYTLPTSLPASSGQVLSCTDAGVMSWASDSTTDNTKMPLAGGTFSGSVIFDGTTTIRGDQNSAAILDLKADEGDDASDIWQVKAEGDNSFYITYWNGSAYEASLQATAEGETALKYNNLTKLATKSAGVQITGQLMNFTTGTAVLLGDNAQLDLGSSNDLKIWHNADGDSYIRNESGNLVIEANGAGDDAIKIFPGAQVELYYDGGTAKLATTSTGVKVSGAFLADDSTDSGTGNSISLGSTQDLKLYFDSSNAYCDFTDSVFYFRHNTNIKFYVQSGGAQFVGSLYADDNNKIELGSNQDFKIYYSGSNNILECRNSKELHINNAEASNLAKFIPGGAAELYFDGTSAGKKFETRSDGVRIDDNCLVNTDSDDAGIGDSSGESQFSLRGNGQGLRLSTSGPSYWNAFSSAEYHIRFRRQGSNTGNIYGESNGTTSFNTGSDYRLKQNVTAYTDGITKLKKLKPCEFEFKLEPGKVVDGFIAHEVTDAGFPWIVKGTKDALESDGKIDPQSMDYSKLTPILTAALQEAIGRIEVLEIEVATLKG